MINGQSGDLLLIRSNTFQTNSLEPNHVKMVRFLAAVLLLFDSKVEWQVKYCCGRRGGRCADNMWTTSRWRGSVRFGWKLPADDICRPHIVCHIIRGRTPLHKVYWLPCFVFQTDLMTVILCSSFTTVIKQLKMLPVAPLETKITIF